MMAAYFMIKRSMPSIKIKCVTILDLMKYKNMDNSEFNKVFTTDKPNLVVYHGYKDLIYQLIYKRENRNFVVEGYMEEGAITTPFDMRVRNHIDRYHLVIDVFDMINILDNLVLDCMKTLEYHTNYIKETGKDIDEVLNFKYEL
jgi:xylulose-5-phosphate/fructose-6-phosphate phosphoketolase